MDKPGRKRNWKELTAASYEETNGATQSKSPCLANSNELQNKKVTNSTTNLPLENNPPKVSSSTQDSFFDDSDPSSGPGNVKVNLASNCNIAGRDINFSSTQYVSHIFVKSSEQPHETDDVQDTLKAIKKLKRIQQKRREDVLLLPKMLKIKTKDVPEVHPRMLHEGFYQGAGAKLNTSYDPKSESNENDDCRRFISFEQLRELNMNHHLITLIGPPGSGKTTTSKRLVGNNENHLCFHIKLAHVEEKRCTLRQLLIDKPYHDLNKKECELVFKWVCEHEDQCSIIMDGFDQFRSTLRHTKLTEATYEARLSPKRLIANLFGKHFLPETHIVLTSRPHAMLKIDPKLRPDETVLLRGLTDEDMQTLFRAYARKNADNLMEYLLNNAPVLLDLCHNPLMLVFTVWAFLGEDLKKTKAIRTVTEMFTEILKKLRGHSENTRSKDLSGIHKQLSELAWNATNNETIEITPDDLKSVNLKPKHVQDLVFAAVDHDVADQRLFEGEEKLYFVHQTWQEYFSALHLTKYEKDVTFKRHVREIVESSNWSTVRRFMSGQLLNVPITGVLNSAKSKVFYENLKNRFDILAGGQTYKQRKKLVEIILDLQECHDSVVKQFAQVFREKIILSDITISPSAAHALARLLRYVDKPITLLDLRNCHLSLPSLKQICDAIVTGLLQIETLDLSFNFFEDIATCTMATVIPNITKMLVLCKAFSRGGNPSKGPSRAAFCKLSCKRKMCGNSGLKIKISRGTF